MAKRGDHEGTIWKLKDGSGFKGSVRLGTNADGTPIRKYVQRQRRDDVVKEIQNLKRKYGIGLDMATNGTVQQFMEQWLDVHVKPPNKSAGTYRLYEQKVRLYIVPVLGKIKLDKLNGLDVQKCLNHALKTGLSPSSVKLLNKVMKTAFTTAGKWRLMERNPAKDATPPKGKKFVAGFLTVEQAELLLKFAKGHRYEAMIVVAVMMGLRLGEVTGLRWSSIEFIKREMHVSETLQWLPGKGMVASDVKTEQSDRIIPIPQMVIDALVERRKIQEQEKRDGGAKWENAEDFIFTSRRGSPVLAWKPGKVLDDLLTQAGLPQIRFHDLRHTTASLLLEQGIPMKMVQAILGHSNFHITMDLYSHLMPNALRRVADSMNDLFAPKMAESVVAPVVAPSRRGTIQ